MFEVELKVHVDDRASLIEKLNKLADYMGYVKRDDYYWTKDNSKIRIRRQTALPSPENSLPNRLTDCTLITYKHKELKKGQDGSFIEVNDEKETLIENAEPVESFLKDEGYHVDLNKVKLVMDWEYKNACLELCTVQHLGDFLEIEILSPSDKEDIIEEYRNKLFNILELLDISRDKIEDRYYSELLKQKGAAGV